MKTKITHSTRTLWIYLILSLISFNGCDNSEYSFDQAVDKGGYTILAKNNSIKTFQNGGGTFIVKMTPDSAFSGRVKLMLSSDNVLKADLSKSELKANDSIFDVTLSPLNKIKTGVYNLMLFASHNGMYKTIEFKVEIMNRDENISEAF
ncbi:MAG: hypothetical protein ABSG15_04560 [FCB group bacterium]|jgi:hypothetical protein